MLSPVDQPGLGSWLKSKVVVGCDGGKGGEGGEGGESGGDGGSGGGGGNMHVSQLTMQLMRM